MLGKLLSKMHGGIWTVRNNIKTKNRLLKKYYFYLYSLYNYENASYIDANASFDGEPFFPHGIMSIFISGNAKIGCNCIIFQQVTIGSNTLPDSKGQGAPTIGNNCFIGAGAKIIGNVMIGNNVRIGAGTVVYKDVPSNCVVVSNEQKNFQKENLDTKFYTWKNGQKVFYCDGGWKKIDT